MSYCLEATPKVAALGTGGVDGVMNHGLLPNQKEASKELLGPTSFILAIGDVVIEGMLDVDLEGDHTILSRRRD